MSVDKELEALIMLWDATHVTHISFYGADPEKAVKELTELMHLHSYSMHKRPGFTMEKIKELLDNENGCRVDEINAAVNHISSEDIKIFFYQWGFRQHTILIVGDKIMTSSDSFTVGEFLECLDTGEKLDKKTLIQEQPLIVPFVVENWEEPPLGMTALAVVELHNQTDSDKIKVYDREPSTSVFYNLPDDIINKILRKYPRQEFLLSDAMVQSLTSNTAIVEDTKHMICQYQTHEGLHMFRLLYGSVVVPFMLCNNTIIHNSVETLNSYLHEIVEKGAPNDRSWLPKYVTDVEKAWYKSDSQNAIRQLHTYAYSRLKE